MPSFMDAPPIAYKYCQIYWRVNWLSWSNFQKLFVKSCNFFCRLVHCVRQEEDDEGNTDCRTTSHFTNQIERLVFYKARPFYRRKNQQNGLAFDMLIYKVCEIFTMSRRSITFRSNKSVQSSGRRRKWS